MEEKPAELPASPSQGGPVSPRAAGIASGDARQETQIQPPPFLDKLKIHKFKILGGVLGILVFTGAVFGAYKLGQRQVQPVLGPTPTSAVVTTPAPDPTANWKTYSNTKVGFSIKYPSEVSLDEKDGYIVFSKWGPTQKPETEFYDGISLRFKSGSLESKTLKEFFDEKVEQSKEIGEILIPPAGTTVAGIEGYTYRSRGLGEHTYFYISHKSGVYLEIINSTSDPTGQGFQETVDLMLSTFRFLEERSQPQVSVPQPVGLARQDLAERLGLSTSSVEILEIEEVLWPDTCLGLPAPELCARGETPGYRVTMMTLGQKYTYHTNTSENFRYAGPGDTPQRP